MNKFSWGGWWEVVIDLDFAKSKGPPFQAEVTGSGLSSLCRIKSTLFALLVQALANPFEGGLIGSRLRPFIRTPKKKIGRKIRRPCARWVEFKCPYGHLNPSFIS